jgi:hypothetical protein
MKTRTSKRLENRQDRPSSFEQLARIGCEQATTQQPYEGSDAGAWDFALHELEAKERSASLPTPDQIFAKYVAGLGGEQA